MNPLEFLPKELEDIILDYKEQLEKSGPSEKIYDEIMYLKKNNIRTKTLTKNKVYIRDFIEHISSKKEKGFYRLKHMRKYDKYYSVSTCVQINITSYDIEEIENHIIEGFRYDGTISSNIDIPIIHIYTNENVNDGLKNRIKRKFQHGLAMVYYKLLGI